MTDIVIDLAAYCRETSERAFTYGEHDCGLWCAGWLDRRIGGTSYSEALRAMYRDRRSAVRMLRDVGHRYRALVSPFLGDPQPPLILPAGSVVVLRGRRHNGLGLLAPSQALGLTSAGSVLAVPMDLVVEGWPCPR
jgi:hypothetical protein